MADEYFNPEDTHAVRALINTALDEDSLPDDVILLDCYKKVAVEVVSAQQATVNTFSKLAAVSYCAALISAAMNDIIKEVDAGVETEFEPFDYKARSVELFALSSKYLALSLTSEQQETLRSSVMPTFFTVAPGGRGL